MGYQDRSYYRDSSHSAHNPLMWLLSGSLHLFTVAGVRVKAHASLLILIVLFLLFQGSVSFDNTIASLTMLFAVVLLHEFGHCFTARAVGGYADEIVMWPLGGLAMATPPHRPLPTFLTVAAGPAVNATICLLAAGALYLLYQVVVPRLLTDAFTSDFNWQTPAFWIEHLYQMSLVLLIFNLLPIHPLDGGQILQSILWHWVGYGKALLISCNVGIVGSALVGLWGLVGGNIFVVAIMVSCLIHCVQRRSMVKAAGVWSFEDYDTDVPHHRHRRHHLSRLAKWKARRQIRQEEQDQVRLDAILQKVHDHGMHSLNWWERRVLKKATDRQRQREMEESGRR